MHDTYSDLFNYGYFDDFGRHLGSHLEILKILSG